MTAIYRLSVLLAALTCGCNKSKSNPSDLPQGLPDVVDGIHRDINAMHTRIVAIEKRLQKFEADRTGSVPSENRITPPKQAPVSNYQIPTTAAERKIEAMKTASKGPFDSASVQTPKVHEVSESPDRFSKKCVGFLGGWIDSDVEFNNGFYELGVTDDRNKYYYGTGDDIQFVTDKNIADALRGNGTADVKLKADLYCRIEQYKSYDRQAVIAWVYEIHFINRGGMLHSKITKDGMTLAQ